MAYSNALSNNETSDRAGGPVLLALDTSFGPASMVIRRGNDIQIGRASGSEEHRSDAILSDLDLLLRSAGVGIKDIDVFGVCVGPGSFTGLRIGLACVKGLAVAARRPVIGVTSLEAVAAGAGAQGRVLSMIRAYKGEVYSQLFSVRAGEAPVPESDPSVTSPEAAVEQAKDFEDVVFAGDGAIDSIELIKRIGGRRFTGAEGGQVERGGWVASEPLAPRAMSVSEIALGRFLRGELEDPETLRACYVRPSEAEIKLSQGLLGSKIRRSAGRE